MYYPPRLATHPCRGGNFELCRLRRWLIGHCISDQQRSLVQIAGLLQQSQQWAECERVRMAIKYAQCFPLLWTAFLKAEKAALSEQRTRLSKQEKCAREANASQRFSDTQTFMKKRRQTLLCERLLQDQQAEEDDDAHDPTASSSGGSHADKPDKGTGKRKADKADDDGDGAEQE